MPVKNLEAIDRIISTIRQKVNIIKSSGISIKHRPSGTSTTISLSKRPRKGRPSRPKKVTKLPDKKQIEKMWEDKITKFLKERFKPWPTADRSPSHFNRRSGYLQQEIRASIQSSFEKGKININIKVLPPDVNQQFAIYNAIDSRHIFAKRVTYLTIPIGANLRDDGTRIFHSISEARAAYDKVFFVKMHGSLIAMGKNFGDKPVSLFLLREQVFIPQKDRWLSDLRKLTAQAKDDIVQQMKKIVAKEIMEKIRRSI